MSNRIELRDGVLGEVVEEFHPIAEQGRELEQLQSAVDDTKLAYDNSVTALGMAENVPETLTRLAEERDVARAAYDEAKSRHGRGLELVGQPSDPATAEPADESEGTPVDVPVADENPQF